ncbi:cyclophane-forming radical SAM/SPASM peptide maturase GrrM/OscB [Silvibacterium sp.]|uniref:cyclophane-forming radical SAM/SPASM peptide maturase GrrM/OscB n=1 Tax=Silvibacterium sp. TaxID=1964179 RepID=UPI0039E48D4C
MPVIKAAPLGLLIIQPTPFCNIDCRYCYLGDRLDKTRMQMSTVEAAARFIERLPLAKQTLPVVWHAGEPLVVGTAFYRDAFQHFASAAPSFPVQHQVQTNATLINDEWCELFQSASVKVGVSIDGPRDVHDAYRVDRSGKGTFDRCMHGISKLREHKVPFTVISVITTAALSRAEEVWNFLSSLGASQLAFNIEEVEGAHERSSLSGAATRELATRFYTRIAELREKGPFVPVRELDDMQRHLTAPVGSTVMRANNHPGAIVNIDVHGNVSTLSPELLGQNHSLYGKFQWANVHRDSWADLMANPQFIFAYQAVQSGVQKCKESCGYFAICGGGNPSNKLAELGTFDGTETEHCRFHVQAVADVMLDALERRQARPIISQHAMHACCAE